MDQLLNSLCHCRWADSYLDYFGARFSISDTWQLVINTDNTIITFLMVFLIQSCGYCILKDGASTERRKVFSDTSRDILNLTIANRPLRT